MVIRQILLVAHTHHDVGYTNSPRIVDDMHAHIVDRVLELACGPGEGRAAPDARDGELDAALRVVGATAWVRSLPHGIQTRVGSGGLVLTPAQAQQVALARLVLLDPHTLVLDEATSLIDPRAARGLERALDRVLQGRTVIAIAHRLHTARDADRVIVMSAGRIIESGSHDALVRLGGEYAALWSSWHGGAGSHGGGEPEEGSR